MAVVFGMVAEFARAMLASDCGTQQTSKASGRCWRETMMDFSDAIRALKNSKRVAREGWNGKGMFLALQRGYPDGTTANANTRAALGVPEGTVVKVRPYIVMKDAQGMLVPWLPSQTDMLADDWTIVE